MYVMFGDDQLSSIDTCGTEGCTLKNWHMYTWVIECINLRINLRKLESIVQVTQLLRIIQRLC